MSTQQPAQPYHEHVWSQAAETIYCEICDMNQDAYFIQQDARKEVLQSRAEVLEIENATLRQALNIVTLILEQASMEGDYRSDAIVAWARTLVPRQPHPERIQPAS